MKSDQSKNNRTIKDFLNRTTFSLKTVVVLSFALIWVLFFIGLVPEQANWEVGTVATRDLQADRSITYEDSEATHQKQMEALKGFQDVYQLNLERFNRLTMVAIDNVFGKLDSIIIKGEAPSGKNEASKEKLADDTQKIDRLKNDVALALTPEEWKELLGYDAEDLDLLHKQTVALVSNIMGVGVKEDQVMEARERIFQDVEKSNALNDLDKKIISQMLRNISFYPTLLYDAAATEQKKEEIIRGVEPVWHTVQKGQMIVNRGDIITASQYDAMEALGLTTDRSIPLIGIGVFAFVFLFFTVIHMYLRRFSKNKERFERDFKLMLLILVLNVIIAAVIFSINIGETTVVMKQVGYLTPLAAGAMITAVLLRTREAIFMLLLSTMMIGFYAQDTAFMVATMIGGIAGIFQVRRLNRRLDLGWAAVYISLMMSVAIIGFGLVYGYSWKVIMLGLLYGIGNGFLSVILTLGLLPYFEVAFDITTSMSLLELGDPSNKLLKRLMMEAPGTYHHSIMVANLGEAAADAIGADPLLVRTGAYYHDIGKLRRPLFFAENQFHQEDPYANISPMLSTLIITSHVKDGVAMAREARLPEVIIDLIAQHHGDTVVRFFYAKAKQADPNVKEDDFRYHQKKPQTREAAILMMADTVEAAVRSARDRLNSGQMEGFIHQLIEGKQKDGQFEECDLTFKDLNDIADVFTRVLCGLYHKRIEYPDTKQLSNGNQGG